MSEILSLTEPLIKKLLDDIIIDDNEYLGENNPTHSNFVGNYYPHIVINDFEISYSDLYSVNLTSKDFLPTVTIKFKDTSGYFSNKHFPLDGSVINLYIRANNRQDFNDIHINFELINIQPIGNLMYVLSGETKVPNLYTDVCKSYSQQSSFDTLMNVAEDLQLGFSSNVDDTSDIMTWLNTFNNNKKFIEDVTKHSYLDSNSWFTSFIDVHYNLNFINVQSCFNINTIGISEAYDWRLPDFYGNSVDYEKVPLLYTNAREFSSKTRFIKNYQMFNNTANVYLTNGYKRKIQYLDEVNELYINPTDYPDDVTIEPFPKLNEYQGNNIIFKGRYVTKDDGSFVKETINNKTYFEQYEKYKYFGKQNENVHDYYYIAKCQNYQNKEEISKIGMVIDLNGTDNSIFRYKTIFVAICEYDTQRKSVFIENQPDQTDEKLDTPIINTFLTDFYVISGIEWIYNNGGTLFQRLHLVKQSSNKPM